MAEALAARTRHGLALYRRLVVARVESQLQYRASFWLNLVGNIGATFIDFAVILVLFQHTSAMAGWSVSEVALLYAISGMAFGLTDLFIGHLDRLGTMVRMGEMDSVLVRPMGSLFQILSADFQLRRVGKLIQAGGVMFVAIGSAPVEWTVPKIAVLVAAVLSGAVLFGAVWVTFASLCFWTTETSEITNSFTYGGNFLASYPIDVFGTWVRRLLAFVIPMAFVAYFPALYLLDRSPPGGWARSLPFISPLVATIAVCVAGAVWRFAVRHYRSSGS